MCKRDEAYNLDAGEIEAIKINQDIIKRMADNSAKMKSIFVTLVGVGVTLLGMEKVYLSWFIAVGYIFIAFVLWYMDASYLRLEQQFREHHKAIVDGTVTNLGQWRFNPAKYQVPWQKAFFSFSTWIYPIFIVGMIITYCFPVIMCYFPAR